MKFHEFIRIRYVSSLSLSVKQKRKDEYVLVANENGLNFAFSCNYTCVTVTKPCKQTWYVGHNKPLPTTAFNSFIQIVVLEFVLVLLVLEYSGTRVLALVGL